MARSSKATASKSGGGIKARGRPAAKKSAAPKRKRRRPQERPSPKPRRPAKGRPQRPLRLNLEPVRPGVNRGDGPQQSPHLGPRRPPRSGRTHLASGARRRAHLAPRRPPRSGRTHLANGARRRAHLAPRNTEDAADGERNPRCCGHQSSHRRDGSGDGSRGRGYSGGGEIVAATADMAESAARAATAVSTGVVSERSQDGEAGSKTKRKRQGRRAGP